MNMDFFEHTMARRLVNDPPPETRRQEEDRFYNGFDDTIAVLGWWRSFRLFWRQVSAFGPREVFRPVPRKEIG